MTMYHRKFKLGKVQMEMEIPREESNPAWIHIVINGKSYRLVRD